MILDFNITKIYKIYCKYAINVINDDQFSSIRYYKIIIARK